MPIFSFWVFEEIEEDILQFLKIRSEAAFKIASVLFRYNCLHSIDPPPEID
jgi:hypothetical protein